MNITYREYTIADSETLLELVKEFSQYSKKIDPIQRVQGLSGYAELSVRSMLENVAKHQGKIWLAVDEAKTIGFISGAIWKQTELNRLEIGPHKLGEVLDLYITEAYREKGIGTTMLEMMEEYFKKSGCDSMWVQVFEPNHPARKLYGKFGFIEREIGMLKNL
ncbi:MAG: GNAT family N-acetyltransferase [bacterium]|nr:GNAT family N-acetyltransferase [bacterium]